MLESEVREMELPEIKVVMIGSMPRKIFVNGFELPWVSHANIPLSPDEIEHIDISLIGNIKIVHESAGLKKN